jgi:hypothetical protein
VYGFFVEPQNQGRGEKTWKSSHEWRLAGGYTNSVRFAVVHHKTIRLLGWAKDSVWLWGQNRSDRFGVAGHWEALKWRTRFGIARLASRLSEVRSLGIRLMVLWQRFPKVPFGGVYPSYVIGVVTSFGCFHINQVERGWQPSLQTLAHLFCYIPFLFSLEFSRTSLRVSWWDL